MKSSLSVILGFHNHIPYGAGDDDGEYIYAARLKPFIQTLNQFPQIPAVLHYSGTLLTWLEANHPELTSILEDMIARKQVEILGGGFYEPMMPLLPHNDKIGQIELLTAYLRKKFGKRPQGCWIPQAAWEQPLVGVLHACGMNYTFLEESHFIAAGLSGAGLSAPCISENQGKVAVVFPLSERLRNAFAVQDADEVLDRLIRETESRDMLATVFPEQLFAGKGGGSAEACYGRFFESLSRVSGDVEFTTPAKYYKNLGRLTKAYFPGDAGRNFLIDYPEANDLYAKMMFTHTLINQLRGDKSRKQNAREELWKAQGYTLFSPKGESPSCGDSADIRRASLRKAVYKALLGAEKICRDQGKFTPSLLAFDFDFDGSPEYLFQDRNINCYVTSAGASIFELDYLPKTWNYLDTFSGNRFRRTAFADQLSPSDYSFQDARDSRLEGVRFCGREYFKLLDMDRSHGRAGFRLPAQEGDASYLDLIEIEKQYLLKQDTLRVRYTLINRGAEAASFKFIPRIDLSFSGGGDDLLKVFRSHAQENEPAIREGAEISNVRGLEFRDIKNELTLSLAADQNFDGWILPIHNSVPIRGAVTAQYQSTCLMPAMALALAPEEQWKTEFTLTISH
ncbi:MAG: DUF1926 domain-containing protein [Treponema sp.]|jgi:hypothetical protein|nr:DUF1926 domain-containing protein [Treponema sp.]